ncbi:MAG: hypothetical protein RMK15_10760 [Chloroflexota bacterium]|nr:hypothetical protein [Dehalococcoidia bacterium]MDW8047745.1 hypothetical protein [Chloroflexota bacterium]
MVALAAALILLPFLVWSWRRGRNEEDGLLAQSLFGLLALAGAGIGIASWAAS